MSKRTDTGPFIITKYEQTCTACPSQWDAELSDGRKMYIRYRWNKLEFRVSTPEHPDPVQGDDVVFERLVKDDDSEIGLGEALFYTQGVVRLADDAVDATPKPDPVQDLVTEALRKDPEFRRLQDLYAQANDLLDRLFTLVQSSVRVAGIRARAEDRVDRLYWKMIEMESQARLGARNEAEVPDDLWGTKSRDDSKYADWLVVDVTDDQGCGVTACMPPEWAKCAADLVCSVIGHKGDLNHVSLTKHNGELLEKLT